MTSEKQDNVLSFIKKFKKIVGIKKISLIFAAANKKDSKTA